MCACDLHTTECGFSYPCPGGVFKSHYHILVQSKGCKLGWKFKVDSCWCTTYSLAVCGDGNSVVSAEAYDVKIIVLLMDYHSEIEEGKCSCFVGILNASK